MKPHPLADHIHSAAAVADITSLCDHLAHVIRGEWQIPIQGLEVESALNEWVALSRQHEVTRLTMPGRQTTTPPILRITQTLGLNEWHLQVRCEDGTYATLSTHGHHDSAEVALRKERERRANPAIVV